MKIVKKNKELVLTEDKKIIEKYSLDEEINFNKLMEYILSLNMKEKINFTYEKKEFNDIELNLIVIINKIIDEYNNKVEDFKKFINENNKKQ